MKQITCGFFALAIAFFTIGCDSGPKNIMEDADAAAVAEYERLTAEDEARGNSDEGGDADEGDL